MEPFRYVPEFNVVVCKDCGFAVLPTHVNAHLGGPKHKVDAARRKGVTETIGQINGLIRIEGQLAAEFKQPTQPVRPIQHLPVHNNGFVCQWEVKGGVECGYIVRTVERIKTHCRTAYGWVNSQRRGGSLAQRRRASEASRPWRTGVRCQRFFKHGPNRKS